jgi:hypothetical protein
VTANAGLGCPEPVFPVRDLDAAAGLYARLGFRIRRYDDAYGFAERDRLCIHLQRSPELDPFANLSAVYVETADVDELHAEWLECGLWLVQTITPQLDAEAFRRWARGDPGLERLARLVRQLGVPALLVEGLERRPDLRARGVVRLPGHAADRDDRRSPSANAVRFTPGRTKMNVPAGASRRSPSRSKAARPCVTR